MKLTDAIVIYAAVLCCSSCVAVRQSGPHDLQDGYFLLKTATAAPQKVYAVITDDSLAIHSLIKNTKQPNAVASKKIALGGIVSNDQLQPFTLVKKSIDLDLSTVLLKYRFRRTTLPNQLSSNLNFAVYSGYRHDYFKFNVESDPLIKQKRVVRHFEFDMGVFAGFGSSPLNASVTANAINVEYDGVVFQKGIALFIGSRNFTIGLGLGSDRLMDSNKKTWIYQEKPWMGVMIGLNLTD
jgi:hypothetical protein